ncbi:hypothetical protein [Trinickia diaoshuihuensis]|uniref:hypothetical protein n=1 Tax=Trinickia diaoshuihuensis TaxID=2292265 RepID=UPI0013C2E3FC|nr:hypothetical protein [Trinickia diaoshuihuensis]
MLVSRDDLLPVKHKVARGAAPACAKHAIGPRERVARRDQEFGVECLFFVKELPHCRMQLAEPNVDLEQRRKRGMVRCVAKA